jgi:hypothetical protein
VVREGVGEGGRNDPNIVCTYELKKKKTRSRKRLDGDSFYLSRKSRELTLPFSYLCKI